MNPSTVVVRTTRVVHGVGVVHGVVVGLRLASSGSLLLGVQYVRVVHGLVFPFGVLSLHPFDIFRTTRE